MITKFELFNKDFPLDTAITEKKRIELEWYQNFINLEFVALNYVHPEKNQYKYFLKGKDKDTIYNNFRRATYTDLEPGKYIFTVKASNNDGIWNHEGTSIEIIVRPAFWQTNLFKALVALNVACSLFLFYYIRMRNMQKRQAILEHEVEVRTSEVVRQKNELEKKHDQIVEQHHEIEMQAEELKTQRDTLQIQRDKIALQNKEITDSIQYAERIQTAVMPTSKVISQSIADHFILFKPKDIVSGDFYWASNQDNKLIVVAADCTGHGVPGAFMSMLGVSFLNKIVDEKRISEPHEILNRLRKNVIEALHQQGAEDEAKDGMDAALLSIDIANKQLRYSGANNPLYLVRNSQTQIIRPDKMPIAYYANMNSFTTIDIELQPNDCLYIFSDGYADQFGGPHGKKMKYKALRDIIEKNHHLPMQEIGQILNKNLEAWQAYPSASDFPSEQIDDILVIGLRL